MKQSNGDGPAEKTGGEACAAGGPLKKFCPVTAFKALPPEKRKKVLLIGGALGGVLSVVLIVLIYLSLSPGLNIKKPEAAKLVPATNCGVFVSVQDLGDTARYVATKPPVASLIRKKAPLEFWKLSAGPELESFEKKFHVKITPKNVLDMVSSDVAYARYPNASKENPTDFIVVTRLGFMERIKVNLGRKKLGPAADMHGFSVHEFGAKGARKYATLAGGYLIVTDSRLLMEQALSIGEGKLNTSVAADALFEAARKRRPGGKLLLEWYSPGGNVKSSLTNLKINYGAIEIGGGGATLYFVSKPHSAPPAGGKPTPPADTPAYLVPGSASLFTMTHSFGRIWEDVLLGKAMTGKEAETFMSDLYGTGLDDLGKYFDGRVTVALDGMITAGGTPVPNLIFAYRVKDAKKAFEAADAIFKKTIRETYNRTPDKHGGAEFVRYSEDYEDAPLSPSFAVLDKKYLVFTLTADEMRKVIDTAHGKSPSLTAQESYKKYFSREAAAQDMFILANGDRLEADTSAFFTTFAGISSRPLAEVINRLVLPSVAMLNHAGAGIGGINYEDGLLIGSLRLDRKIDKTGNSAAAAKKKRKRELM